MELRQLQAQPELLASTEAFKACERELSIAQRELQKVGWKSNPNPNPNPNPSPNPNPNPNPNQVLEEYRAALGLYHRTARRPPA